MVPMYFLSIIACVQAGQNFLSDDPPDYMLFDIEWKPAQCLGKSCPTEYKSNYFNIHGMWPNYKDGGYPSNCPSQYSYDVPASLEQDLNKYWQSYNGDSTWFWQHEWSKHGTCVAKPLSCPAYFQAVLDAYFALKPLDTLKAKGIEPGMSEVTLSEVYAAFDSVINVNCEYFDGKHYLSVLKLCYDNDWKRIDCVRTGTSCAKTFAFNTF